MVTPGGRSLDPSKLIILIIVDSFWMCGALGIILTIIVSSSHLGNGLGARDMTSFSFHFLLHVTEHGFSY